MNHDDEPIRQADASLGIAPTFTRSMMSSRSNGPIGGSVLPGFAIQYCVVDVPMEASVGNEFATARRIDRCRIERQELDLRIGHGLTTGMPGTFRRMPRTPAPAPLGSIVRQLRERAGFTQAQLAEKAGMVDATISRIERGRLHPSAIVIGKLAAALNVATDDLIGRRLSLEAPSIRTSVAKLLAVVDGLDDGQVDDVTRAVKLLLEAGRRSSRAR